MSHIAKAINLLLQLIFQVRLQKQSVLKSIVYHLIRQLCPKIHYDVSRLFRENSIMVIRAQGTALLKRKQQTEQKTKSQIFVKSVERSVWVTKISLDAVRFLFNICAKFTCTGTHTIINPFRISQQFCDISQDIGIIAQTLPAEN